MQKRISWLLALALLPPLLACEAQLVDEWASSVARLPPSDDDISKALAEHYPTDRVLRYELEVDPALLEAMRADPLCEGAPPCGDEYVEGRFRYGDQVFEHVGVRFKGNSSRWMLSRLGPGDPGYQRYSYKIKLDEFVDDQTLGGIEKLNLNNLWSDASYMRERLSLDLFRAAGVPASRLAYVNLYLNGEHVGLYVSVQQVDQAFLAEWFGAEDGDLYKPEGGDLIYKGEEIAAYGGAEAYERKTNKDDPDYSRLIHFIDVLNNAPEAELEQAISELFDVDGFLAWLAANTALVALDSYAGPFPHNFYLYDDPSSGRFAYIPWDLNNSFGSFNCGLSALGLTRMSADAPYCQDMDGPGGGAPGGGPGAGTNTGNRPLISRLLAVPSFAQRYRAQLRQLLDGDFSPAAIDAAIERWRALIDLHVAADPKPFYGHDAFVQSFDENNDRFMGLRPFVVDRVAFLDAELGGDLSAYCGDGVCSGAEGCEADCTVAECPPCQVYLVDAGHCVPTCGAGCTCPDDLPMTLVCHPAGAVCVPSCSADADCPPQAPSCEVATGLCG